ncbi:MAG: hypothetical protein ACKOXO_04960 [Cyanobium sp.]
MTTPRQRLIVEASDDTLHIPLPAHLRHRRLEVTLEAVDEPVAASWATPNRDPEHIKRVLAKARGSWGDMSADEIDRMIEESRRNDWREPWEECRDVPS